MQTWIKWPADTASGQTGQQGLGLQALHTRGQAGGKTRQQLVVAPGGKLVALLGHTHAVVQGLELLGQGLQAGLAPGLLQQRTQGQSEFGLGLQLALESKHIVRVAGGQGSGLAARLLQADELGGRHRWQGTCAGQQITYQGRALLLQGLQLLPGGLALGLQLTELLGTAGTEQDGRQEEQGTAQHGRKNTPARPARARAGGQ